MKYICIFLGVLFLASCDQPTSKKILGSWQIDSVYDYHNGFTFTNRSPYPREVYEYKPDNTLLRKGMGEQLEYRYTCKDSILSLSSAQGTSLGKSIIIFVTDKRLALKENLISPFPGKNETRYEIRYFSRVDSLK